MTDGSSKPSPTAVLSIESVNGDHAKQAAVTLNIANQNITFQVRTQPWWSICFVLYLEMRIRLTISSLERKCCGFSAGSFRDAAESPTQQQSRVHRHPHPRPPAGRDDAVPPRQRHLSDRSQGTQATSCGHPH